jgi:translation initiation factor IF-3|tara:strand:- start:33 stop:686 length:654 start_codon:yes stop_codon:yes gene_type:complete
MAPSPFFNSLNNLSNNHFNQYRPFSIRRKRVVPKGNKRKEEMITNADIRRYVGGMDTEIRLVYPDGSNKIMSLLDALERGRDEDLDIVLIASNAKPPTCKILDVGLHKYQQRRKEAEKRKSAPLPTKTMKFKVKIEKGDFSRKVEQAREFLSKGHNLRLAIVLVTRFPQGEQRAEFLYREFVTSIEDLIVESRAKGLTQDGALRTADFQSNCTKEGN